MRNLKRALSLALASVMLVGMMVVGTSAASYPDVDSNDNVEAISVLQAVGVMQGDGDTGEFRPNDQVSRNEMAVIMARLLLGPDADDYVGTHPFTDVPAWADKYVAACYNDGIIKGTSDTTYSGTATVTAQEAAAMMLRALGYEKLESTGADWARNVVSKANEIRLFKSVGSNPNASMTRNQIAQLGLNTLQADVVTTKGGTDINLGDLGTISSAVEYNKVSETEANDYRTVSADKDEVQQLCEKLYGKDLQLNTDDSDGVGRPASTWTCKGVGDVITTSNEADYTVVLEESPSTLQDLFDLAKKNLTSTNVTAATAITLNNTAISALTDIGAGDVVEFYMDEDDSKVIDSIFVTRYELNKIDAIDDDVDDDDAEDGVTCYVDFDGNGGTAVKNTDIPGFNADTYVEDAYVALLVNDSTEIVDSYIVEPTEDSVDTVKGTTEITIDGTKYTAAAGIVSGGDYVAVNAVAPGSDNTYAVYLDSNGYILGIVAVEGESAGIDDVYYLDAVWKVSGKSDTYYAQIVNLDGTVSEIKLETADHSFGDSLDPDLSDSSYDDTDYAALRGRLVTISDKKVNSTSKANNDKYNLKEWDIAGNLNADWAKNVITAAPAADLKKDSRTLGSYRLNASTVYLFLEKTGDDLDVSRYVGGVAFDKDNIIIKSDDSTYGSYVITEEDKNVAKYVLIYTDDASQNAEFSSDVIFIKEASTTKGDGFRSQTVYLPNGKEETWKIDEGEYSEATLPGAPGFFTYGETDDGYYELGNPDPMTVASDLDWQENKPEGVLAGVTFDDDNDLFEDMLTVTNEDNNTITDIDVAGASFKDLHDKDADGQYTRTVTSLSSLATLIKDNKVGAATLYMNVSKDGAVTIFATEIDEAVEDAPSSDAGLTFSIAVADGNTYNASWGDQAGTEGEPKLATITGASGIAADGGSDSDGAAVITLTKKPAAGGQVVKTDGTEPDTTTSGALDATELTYKVTAEDNSTVCYYKVTITLTAGTGN